MKEAIVLKGPKIEIKDVPIPKPNADQVVIKVVVSGSNPKDWKYPEWRGVTINQGDDIAGIVHEVGENVTEFKPGDRVAAFHEMASPNGSYAEYAVAWAYTTFHIPKKTSFEEAATIPLAAMTAAVGLYQRLSLPVPWNPTSTPNPLIIYGAATAVGSFAIQLAQVSNIHPLIVIAGRGTKHAESLISPEKGDVILDYREGDEKLQQNLKKALEKYGGKTEYAFDAVAEHNSDKNIASVLDHQKGKVTFVLPQDYSKVSSSIFAPLTMVGSVHSKDEPETKTPAWNRDFGFVFFRLFGRGLEQGWFKGHPYEVVPGGLNGVEKALTNLKEGKASAVKYVFRIADTEGAGK